MSALRVAVAFPLSIACVVACSFPTGGGGHGGHHGGTCSPTTFLTDDFSGGSLANWAPLFGTPQLSNAVGDPPPSALMRNAAMQSVAAFSSACGLTFSSSVRVDSGFALIKIVVPGVARVAMVKAFDTLVVYMVCGNAGCTKTAISVAADTAWHAYRFVISKDSLTGSWFRDGALTFAAPNLGVYDTLRVNLGAFPADSSGTGPALGYFDNVLATSP
jgi:hypothetical protein